MEHLLDYRYVLADMYRKRDALDRAIESLRKYLEMTNPQPALKPADEQQPVAVTVEKSDGNENKD